MTFIRAITADDCLPLRHHVLWPQFPPADSRLDGDEDAAHYGLFLKHRLIGCLSVFALGSNTCQIRKFATDTAYQHQGYGSRLITYVLAHQQQQGVQRIVLNARLTATGFYTRFGFRTISDVRYKVGIPYVLMERNA